jgi:hypothetical protein
LISDVTAEDKGLQAVLLSNRAMCFLKLDKPLYRRAIEVCSLTFVSHNSFDS